MKWNKNYKFITNYTKKDDKIIIVYHFILPLAIPVCYDIIKNILKGYIINRRNQIFANIYLDNAATTRISGGVRGKTHLKEYYGNPSSIYIH